MWGALNRCLRPNGHATKGRATHPFLIAAAHFSEPYGRPCTQASTSAGCLLPYKRRAGVMIELPLDLAQFGRIVVVLSVRSEAQVEVVK